MNVDHQPTAVSSYGYDSAHPAFQGTGTKILGYDSPAGWFKALHVYSVAGNISSLRPFTGKERDQEIGSDYFGGAVLRERVGEVQ